MATVATAEKKSASTLRTVVNNTTSLTSYYLIKRINKQNIFSEESSTFLSLKVVALYAKPQNITKQRGVSAPKKNKPKTKLSRTYTRILHLLLVYFCSQSLCYNKESKKLLNKQRNPTILFARARHTSRAHARLSLSELLSSNQ